MIKEYEAERENYTNLWNVFARNCLTDHFRKSMYAGFAMVLVPSSVNVYYIFRQSVLKNTMRICTIMSSIIIFHYCLNRDFEEFLKLDLPDSNLARTYIQNISKNDLFFPYFGEETREVIKKRS